MKSVKKNKVGFIGLGIMGKPMVINLIKNDIKVYFYARKRQIIDEISAEKTISMWIHEQGLDSINDGSMNTDDTFYQLKK